MKAFANVDPRAMGYAGKMFTAVSDVARKLGVPLTGDMAKHALKGMGKMLGKWTPAVGAGFAAYDMAVMGQIAANRDLPPEIRYLGGLGVALNGVDAGLGVAEMFGVGNIGLPANLALGASSLGLDLYTHHLINQHKAGNFKSSPQLDALIAGSALSMGPAGMALMLGNFGAAGTQRKLFNAGKVGSNFALDSAVRTGLVTADATGKGLKLTAKGIDGLADVIRHPEKFGQALNAAGLKVQDVGRNAIAALGDATRYAGELGGHARKALGDTANWLGQQGQQGLDTLKWMARNPGTVAGVARAIRWRTSRGGVASSRAKPGMASLRSVRTVLAAGQQLARDLQKQGARGVEMLKYMARNPGQAAGQIRDAAMQGMHDMAMGTGARGAGGGRRADGLRGSDEPARPRSDRPPHRSGAPRWCRVRTDARALGEEPRRRGTGSARVAREPRRCRRRSARQDGRRRRRARPRERGGPTAHGGGREPLRARAAEPLPAEERPRRSRPARRARPGPRIRAQSGSSAFRTLSDRVLTHESMIIYSCFRVDDGKGRQARRDVQGAR